MTRPGADAARTEVLRNGPQSSPDAAETQVLPAGAGPDAGAPDVLGARIRRTRMAQEQDRNGRAGTGRAGSDPAVDRTDVLPSAAPTRAFPAPAPGAGGPGPATAALRDPWQDAGPADGSEHTHDPHEVTVQLDAVQLGDGVLRQAKGGAGNGPDNSDGPVFVDASGRRSRRFRRLGIAVGIVCAIYAVVMVSTLLSGNSNAPWLPVPGQQKDKPAGQVDTTPLPSQSAQPSSSGSAAPQVSPSAGDGTTSAPGADASAPGTSDTAGQPGTGTGSAPSASRTAPLPGGGATDPDPTESTATPPDPGTVAPSTPAGGGEPSADPTGSTDPGGGDTGEPGGTAVNGAAAPSPVGAPAAASTSPSLSPEYTL
ncbi:hypothetical protein AB0L35_33735 [Streptomyces sp. NPDC052309]|uniref:hypothetical protein n=1 Tax=Streptomyces sp. NPDC052309 TaxID=3155421 RepID=UPI0034296256